MCELIKQFKSKEWQTKHSSLAEISEGEVTYEQCRKYACEDIAKKLTYPIQENKFFIIEIPEGTEFHFIGRVDTSQGGNKTNLYYKTFEDRDFVAFSTINNQNISHYRGKIFFAYNILPEDIVHIFPIDSDTKKQAKSEEELTWLPSLWLTLQDLEELTKKLKVYNQITCKTKRNGQILKPFAIIAFNQLDEYIEKVAKEFQIGCIIVHPDKDAINYNRDLLYDYSQLNSIAPILHELYEIPAETLVYLD